MTREDAIHPSPAWRDRADFIIGAQLPEPGRSEQLWARQIDEKLFEVCCIPFFLYDVALGDIVETDASYDVIRVVSPSGRFVFRAWFGETLHWRDDVAARLHELGALLEWSSSNLLAIDAANEAVAKVVADYLCEQERGEMLTYETGRT